MMRMTRHLGSRSVTLPHHRRPCPWVKPWSMIAHSIVDDVKLPTAAAQAVRTYATLRKKAEQEDRRVAAAARRAVRMLRGGRLKMSARDAARLLGLSHQRVHQLTQNEADER